MSHLGAIFQPNLTIFFKDEIKNFEEHNSQLDKTELCIAHSSLRFQSKTPHKSQYKRIYLN